MLHKIFTQYILNSVDSTYFLKQPKIMYDFLTCKEKKIFEQRNSTNPIKLGMKIDSTGLPPWGWKRDWKTLTEKERWGMSTHISKYNHCEWAELNIKKELRFIRNIKTSKVSEMLVSIFL